MLKDVYEHEVAVHKDMDASCPEERPFPLPDPPKSAKRPLDFAPFAAALAGFGPEQAAAVHAAVADKTVLQIAALLDDGALSSEHLVLYYLDRIRRYDEHRLNAVIELHPAALDVARERDAARAATPHGPLFGIPVMLKDNIATAAPLHTTAGNYALKDWQLDRDAFLVTQLHEAGAIILGKNNLSEWANYNDPCMPNGFSALGGQTRNPHGPFDPLGSSSGSAVAVAASFATLCVGSETAGSLVQPARATGIVALRPSKGLVSGDYVIPLEPTLDTAGPMGRTVTDVAALLSVLAASDPSDTAAASAATLAGTDFTRFLSLDVARTVRVGVVVFDSFVEEPAFAERSPEDQHEALDERAARLFGATRQHVAALASQGIVVVPIMHSALAPLLPSHLAYLSAGFQRGFNAFFGAMQPPAPVRSLADVVAVINEDAAARAPYGQRFVERTATHALSDEDYHATVREARHTASEWITAVTATYGVDVLIYGVLYNAIGAAGVPAINVPAGCTTTGAPTGIYITGPHLSDGQVLAVAYALEQALGGRLMPDLDAAIRQIEETRDTL